MHFIFFQNGRKFHLNTRFFVVNLNEIQTEWSIVNDKKYFTPGLNPLQIEVSSPGIYDVEINVTTGIGDGSCPYNFYLTEIIEVWERPEADFLIAPEDISIFSTDANFTDISTGGAVDWLWTFEGAPNPNTSNLQNPAIVYKEGRPGDYNVYLKVWDERGCTDSIRRVLTIANDVNIFAPKAFSPDGDGINDEWKAFVTGIQIYDFHYS